MNKTKQLFVVFLVLPCLPFFAHGERLKIDVGRAGSKKSVVAFPSLFDQAKFPGNGLEQKIAKNMEFSSYFKFADLKNLTLPSSINAPVSEEFSKALSKKGIEFLILGKLFNSGSTSNATFKIYYLSKNQLALNKTFSARKGNWTTIANKFSNDFIQLLTGKKSIFNTRLVFTSDRPGRGYKEVYVSNWDGSGLRRITYHKSSSFSPKWSPGGNQVIYSAITISPKKRTRNTNLYIYDFRTKKRGLLSRRPGANSGGSFFPDGRSLIMTLTQGGNPDLFKLGLDGRVLERITKGPNGAMNVEPAISPEGSRLAFSSDRSGKPMLYVMDLANKVPKRLTIAGRYNSTPSWAPDGKKIAFAGWDKGHFDIYVIDANGRNLLRLTEKKKANGRWSNNESPSFSPDGRFIVFTSNRTGKREIYMVRTDGSGLKQLTNDKFNYFHTQWSPFLK